MIECRQIEPLLTPYVDGHVAPADAASVEQHLPACPACRARVSAEQAARTVLQARAEALRVPAPPGMRTRLAALAEAERPAAVPGLGWRARFGAFAAAAALVVAVGAGALAVLTPRSSVLLAAQLALDHLKCFAIDGFSHLPTMSEADAEARVVAQHGWTVEVPPSRDDLDLRLVTVRECLYADGWAAHILYRSNGEPVSLFILPGFARPDAEIGLLGQASQVWSAGDRTYVLMTPAGNQAALARVASYVRDEAQ